MCLWRHRFSSNFSWERWHLKYLQRLEFSLALNSDWILNLMTLNSPKMQRATLKIQPQFNKAIDSHSNSQLPTPSRKQLSRNCFQRAQKKQRRPHLSPVRLKLNFRKNTFYLSSFIRSFICIPRKADGMELVNYIWGKKVNLQSFFFTLFHSGNCHNCMKLTRRQQKKFSEPIIKICFNSSLLNMCVMSHRRCVDGSFTWQKILCWIFTLVSMYGLTDPFITWIEVILCRQLRSDSLPDQRVKVEYVIRDGTLALHNRSSAMSTFCLFIYSTDIRVSEVLWHLNTYSASIDEEFPSLSNQMELTLIIESEVILVKLNKIWFLLTNALLWYLIYEILNLILELDEHKIFIRNKQQIIAAIKTPIKFQFEQDNIYSMFHRVSGIQLSSNFSRFPFNYSADCTFKLSADYHP